jgi:hypothetical protein
MPTLSSDLLPFHYTLPAALAFILLVVVFLRSRSSAGERSRLQSELDRLRPVSSRSPDDNSPSKHSYPATGPTEAQFNDLVDIIHRRLVSKLKLPKDHDFTHPRARGNIRRGVEHLVDTENPPLNRLERERLVDAVVDRIPALRRTPSSNQPEAGPSKADDTPR